VFTLLSLFAIFAAQLLLSIAVSDGAYQLSGLQQQQKGLLRTQDSLSEQVQVLNSSQNLAAQANHVGMVPNSSPLAINLTTGAIYSLPGTADPAGCGGACNLITNALLSGVALVPPTASAPAAALPVADTGIPSAAPASASGAAIVSNATTVVDSLPAPVTR